jgi:hypothetical protein
MTQIRKKDVRRAIARAAEMFERNRDGCDTFEGVLARGYVRALKILIGLGEHFLVPRKPLSRTNGQTTQD